MQEGLQTVERVFTDEVPLFGGARARRLVRRRRVVTATAIGLTLLIAAGGGFVATQRNKATAVTVDQALKEFRAAGHAALSSGVRANVQAPVSKATSTTRAAARAAVSPGSVTSPVAALAPFVAPAEGVYTYKTKGGESISVFGASHTYPDETTSTVRHLGGCRWQQTSTVIKEHTDERVLCSQSSKFLQLSQGRQVEFFGQRDGQTYRCSPAELQASVADRIGATSTETCKADDGSTAAIKRTFVGRESMIVGGTKVDAVHFRLDSTMHGKANGTSVENFWVSPLTGLPLRWDRAIDTMAHASFGANVRYRENVTFVLKSLRPRS